MPSGLMSYKTSSLNDAALVLPDNITITSRIMHFSRLAACYFFISLAPLRSPDPTRLEISSCRGCTRVPGGARSAPHRHFTTVGHLGLYWERHLELGGSALNSAAWATRLTAVINVPRGHGLQTVSVEHLCCRLRIHPKIVLAPTDGAVEMPEGAHGRGNSLQ